MSKLNPKKRSPKNKTLTITEAEYEKYLKKLFIPQKNAPITAEQLLDKTIHANLFEIIDFLPHHFADLIIIDPPYNLDKDFDGLKFKASDHKNYLDYLRSWFPKMIPLLKENGSLYICGDWKCTAALHEIMEENLTVLNRITWQREKGRGALRNWKNAMEDIWFGVKNKNNYYFDVNAVKMKRKVIAPYKVNGIPKDWQETANGKFRITYPSNFWDDITVPYWSMPENTEHPTQKPEKLIAKLILASCPPGGMVFDPFLGSGTTSVVAKKLGRKYSGIELNEKYCIWAEKRLEKAEENTFIQGYTDGIFWERNTLPVQEKTISKKKKQ